MRLLVTGASGLYGSKFSELALSENHQVYSVHNQHSAPKGIPIQLDIMEREEVQTKIGDIRPDAIVHAAAMTDVDKCELNRELSWKINVEGTKNVVQAAKSTGSFLLYISTDYVFDGEKGNYKESDLPSPISYYGYTKLKAEEYVRNNLDEYCIARPSVIYGASPAAGKTNFALWLLNKLGNSEKANVFFDQYNSPTLNSSLAEMTLESVERKLTGMYHMSGGSRISRYDFALSLSRIFGLDESLLVPSKLKDFHFPAKRPADSSLDTSKADNTLKHKPLKVNEALQKLRIELNTAFKF